jgi:hypothetical protein
MPTRFYEQANQHEQQVQTAGINRSTWTSMLCSAREPTEVACMGGVR